MSPGDQSPPDNDLLGLEVTAIAAVALLGTMAAFFFVGPVAGIVVLIVVLVLVAWYTIRKFGESGGST
ncbi:MAG: hypothetical protein U0R52_05310 [Solirubrobacterales bacterium]